MSLGSTLRLLPLLGLAGCALFSLASQKKAWPDHAATVAVKGPTKEIAIARDGFGIPHIRASSTPDAMYALGFAHAQDRLFQADLTRRLIYGEASTLLGDRTVDFDGFVRGMEVRKRAAQTVQKAPFPVQAVLIAYSAGFNAGRDSLEKLPIEYELLGVETVPDWQPADCVANVYLQSWNLAENPEAELAALALKDLDADVLDRLLRFEVETPALEPGWNELRAADIGAWTPGWKGWTGLFGGIDEPTSEASNNWVVGPEISADGAPIVANDPHLSQRVPSIWYAADIQGGDLHAAGMTFPGSPAVVIGHNENVAWGLTNVMADYVDFAILETADEGRAVIHEGAEMALEKVAVNVEVKGGESVPYTTWYSPIGPVLTERNRSHVVVLRWHALELADESTTAFFELNHATTAQEAIAAMQRPMSVAQNLVVGDVHGDYAWQSVGSVPVRKAHTGRIPYDGSSPDHGWEGWYAELPGERAPERGWVATANQRPTRLRPAALPIALDEEGQPVEVPEPEEPPADIDVHGITTGWAQPWRYNRIAEQLSAQKSWTPEAVASLQTDVRDLQAATLLPQLLEGVKGSNAAARRCRDLLAGWDHEVDIDSVEATVWVTFQRELLREALADDIGADAFDIYLQVHSTGRNLLGVGIDDWVSDRKDAVDSALIATCNRLESTLGESEEAWRWGAVHPLKLEHPFASGRALLSKWNAPVRDFPGNSNTVAAASAGWQDGEKPVGGMASLRIVMPLSDLSKSTLVHPGGQSGFPRHPDAFSQFDAFVKGETLPLYFSIADVVEHTVSTQTLVPLKSGAKSDD